jgi:hypothetical protein
MKFEKKVILILLCTSFTYVLCAAGGLFLYIHAHPGGLVPRGISVPMLCLLILLFMIVVTWISLRRVQKAEAAGPETKQRQAF